MLFYIKKMFMFIVIKSIIFLTIKIKYMNNEITFTKFKIWLLKRKQLSLILLSLFLPLIGYTQTYCTPTYIDDCLWDDDLNSFILTGHGTSVINDLNTGCTSGGYLNKTTALLSADLLPGQTYTVQLNTNYWWGSDEKANIWIDFNNNGTFETSEKVLADLPLDTSPTLTSATISVPISVSPGVRRMRVRGCL